MTYGCLACLPLRSRPDTSRAFCDAGSHSVIIRVVLRQAEALEVEDLKLMRLLNIQFSLAHIVGWLLVGACWIATPVFSITFWAELRGVELSLPTLFATLWANVLDPVLWLVVLGSVLVAFQPGQKILDRVRGIATSEGRCNYAVRGLHFICDGMKRRQKHSFVAAYESLLQAAAIELTQALNITSPNEVRTNLLLAVPNSKIKVIARSRPGSPVGVVYGMDDGLAAGGAMTQNKTVVVAKLPSALADGKQRHYRTVVASPVARGNRCFGAITADSSTDGLFDGKEAEIERVLLPYAAAIMITLSLDESSVDCPERYE